MPRASNRRLRAPHRPLRGTGPLETVEDPLSGGPAELRQIQPYAATKPYRCPGCNQEIHPGTGHVVLVPLADPGERRHWHRSCYANRERRPPGR